MKLITLFSTPILAFIISLLLFPVLIKLLTKWELYDSHKDHKIHDSFTPSMGGIAIYAGLILTLAIVLPFQEWIRFKFFFIATTLMFIIGLRDDVLGLTPIQKLVSQLLPISILVILGQLYVSAEFFNHDLSGMPVWLAAAVSMIVVVLVTNSYNLIDGIDGLAGSVGGLCLSIFGVWFYLTDSVYLSLIAFAVVGAVLAFLVLNWEPSKIFMGDTGALLIGLLLAYFSIQFINANESLDIGDIMKFKSSIGTVLCILIIPVFDTSRVIVFRLRKGLSPFRADKNHVHHQFLNMGFNHSNSVISILIVNVLFILISWMLKNQPDHVILPLIVILCLFINFALKLAQKHAGTNIKTSK